MENGHGITAGSQKGNKLVLSWLKMDIATKARGREKKREKERKKSN